MPGAGADKTAIGADLAKEAGYSISLKQLRDLAEDRELDDLNKLGGAEAMCSHLLTHPEMGLTSEGVDRAQRVFGLNKLPEKKSKSYLMHLFESLQVRIHVACAAACSRGGARGSKGHASWDACIARHGKGRAR